MAIRTVLVRGTISHKTYSSHNFLASQAYTRSYLRQVHLTELAGREMNSRDSGDRTGCEQVQKTPSMSTRSLEHAVRLFHSSTRWFFQEHDIHFKCRVTRHSNRMIMQLELLLQTDAFLNVLQIPFFSTKVLFSDEASFTREGIF